MTSFLLASFYFRRGGSILAAPHPHPLPTYRRCIRSHLFAQRRLLGTGKEARVLQELKKLSKYTNSGNRQQIKQAEALMRDARNFTGTTKVIAYNMMIKVYGRHREVSRAAALFRELKVGGEALQPHTYEAMIR